VNIAVTLREPWDDVDDAIADLRRMGIAIAPGDRPGTWRLGTELGWTAARLVSKRDDLLTRQRLRHDVPAEPEPERPGAPLPAAVAQFVLPRGPAPAVKTDQRRVPLRRAAKHHARPRLAPLTAEQEAYLRRVWAQPVSFREMSKVLGRSHPMVRRCAERLGLGPKVYVPRGTKPLIIDDERADLFRRMWQAGVSAVGIGREFGVAHSMAPKIAARFGLDPRPASFRSRKHSLHSEPRAARGDNATAMQRQRLDNAATGHDYRLSRFAHRPRRDPGSVTGLAADHPAIIEARTKYPHRVFDPAVTDEAVLKSGHNNAKIGAVIRKGRWAGFPIYTLTLEERATCPQACRHFRTCYGNSTNWGRRFRHGPALEVAIARDLRALQNIHPGGFAVRLHALGDFYDLGYVDAWALWLDEFPALHVFGYTAWPVRSEIGGEIAEMRRRRWNRFAVRTSNGGAITGAANTVDVDPLFDWAPSFLGLVCPEQHGKTAACATCGLCWAGDRKPAVDRIAFILH
jgi:hypothetical protein